MYAWLGRALEIAKEAALAASDELAAAFRARDVRVETKPDGSPVTRWDRAAEERIRAVLEGTKELPRTSILGEEFGETSGGAEFRWVIDPIDGTSSFIRGVPTFGTLIALEERASSRAIAGVIHFPVSGDTYGAARGAGATKNSWPIYASRAAPLREAIISVADSGRLRKSGLLDGARKLWEMCDATRGYNDCWAHALAAEGAIHAVVEARLEPWDYLASQVIVEESGGALRIRPSPGSHKFDVLMGNEKIIEELADVFEF